jgi:hypothetical protein
MTRWISYTVFGGQCVPLEAGGEELVVERVDVVVA